MKKSTRVLAILLTMALMLTGCSSGGSATGSSGGQASSETQAAPAAEAKEAAGSAVSSSKDTLVIRMQSDPGTLDISQGAITEALQIYSIVGSKLLVTKMDENGMYSTVTDDNYSLAASYDVDEDMSGMVFHLREGVKWHDGSELVAEDVAYSIKRYSGQSQYNYIDFDNIEVVDDHTLHVRLVAPNSQAINAFGSMFICSPRAVSEDDPTTLSKKYVGTGGWYIDNWVDGDSITLKAFADYWTGEPAIKTIVVRFISDASVAMMELETGGIDILDTPNWSSVSSVMNGNYEGQLKYTRNTDLYLHHLWFNCSQDSPFHDIRVRHAVMYAIDRDALIYGAFEGLGEKAWTMESVTMEGVISLEDSWPFTVDLEKAKSLLAEAGYPDGFDAIITNYGDQNDVLADEIIARQLEDIGIRVTIQSYDTPTWISRLTEQTTGWDMTLRLYGGTYPMTRWTNNTIPQMWHVSPENNPDYKELYELSQKALGTMDTEARNEIQKEIQERWFDEWAYTLPIHQKIQYNLFQNNLEGVERYGYAWFMLGAYFK